jgi:hypothetical protein
MFHVPEHYRIRTGPLASTRAQGNNGAFMVPSRSVVGRVLWIIASDGSECPDITPWEHVSVHSQYGRPGRPGKLTTPNWPEMCQVKDLFWDPEDVVMQLHPAQSEYVNHHPWTLHLWRPVGQTIPLPPSILVGPPDSEVTHGIR